MDEASYQDIQLLSLEKIKTFLLKLWLKMMFAGVSPEQNESFPLFCSHHFVFLHWIGTELK